MKGEIISVSIDKQSDDLDGMSNSEVRDLDKEFDEVKIARSQRVRKWSHDDSYTKYNDESEPSKSLLPDIGK